MAKQRIGPVCPYCGGVTENITRRKTTLKCYGVVASGNGKIRYFLCENCGVHLARSYGNQIERWAGLVRPILRKTHPA